MKMVAQVRDGLSQREVARACRVSLSTVQRWLARAGDLPLDEVDWGTRPSGCRVSPRRTKAKVEDQVLSVTHISFSMHGHRGGAVEVFHSLARG